MFQNHRNIRTISSLIIERRIVCNCNVMGVCPGYFSSVVIELYGTSNETYIYLGDNRYVKAMKIGNVVSYFDAFGKKNEVYKSLL